MHEERVETELMLAVPLQERRSSVGSLRPVGLTVRASQPDRTYETLSNEWDISERRRRLARVVVGAVAACGIILAAAGVRLLAGLVPSSLAAANPPTAAVRPTAEPAGSLAAPQDPSGAAPVVPTAVAPAASEAAPITSVATMGKLLLERPASPGHVWLDGERLTQETATVACGKHEIRIGLHGRTRSIDVPCGGDLHVSR